MNLNDFSSYFEIFTGLNLLYAGSEAFRSAISERFLKTTEEMSKDVDLLRSKLSLTLSESYNADLQATVEDLAVKKSNIETALDKEKKHRDFPIGFKSMFLITGLYCLTILLVGGFEQFFKCSETANFIILIISAVFLYNISIVIRSFFPSACFINLRNSIPVTILIGLITISLVVIFNVTGVIEHTQTCNFGTLEHSSFFPERTTIGVALFIGASPFVFHFLRLFQHEKWYLRKFEQLKQRTGELKEVEEKVTAKKDVQE